MSENREIDPSVILAKTKAELIKTVTPQEVVDYLNHNHKNNHIRSRWSSRSNITDIRIKSGN